MSNPWVPGVGRCIALAMLLGACGTDVAGPSGPSVQAISLPADTIFIPALDFDIPVEVRVEGARGDVLTGLDLKWGIRDPFVGHAPRPGIVVGRENGESTLIVSRDGIADSAVVRVFQIPSTITITRPDTLRAGGQRIALEVIALDAGGHSVRPYPVHWTSSDSTVAIAYDATNNGLHVLEAGRSGTARLTASLHGVTGTVDVVVAQTPRLLWLRGGVQHLALGDTTTIEALIHDPEGREIRGLDISWESSSPEVATVSSSGLVTAIAAGHAVITARHEDLSGWTTRVVHPDTPIDGTLGVAPGQWATDAFKDLLHLEAYVTDAEGTRRPVPASWRSRDEEVVVVKNSVAISEGTGATWLVAEYEGQHDSVRVEVNRERRSLLMPGSDGRFDMSLLHETLIELHSLDRVGTAVPEEPVWTSRDPTIVTVASPWYVRGGAAGTTWLVAELGGLVDSVRVVVHGIYPVDLTIESQEEFNAFARRGVREVLGSVTIQNTLLSSLDGLESLRRIGGELRIQENDRLEDMSGLRNLERVEGAIVVAKNPTLMAQLPSLQWTYALAVFENGGLAGESPFASLTYVLDALHLGDAGSTVDIPSLTYAGSLTVRGPAPRTLRFGALTRVNMQFSVIEAAGLTILEAPVLGSARDIVLRANSNLSRVEFPRLFALRRDLIVEDNAALESLDGFRGLTSGLRRLGIERNGALRDLDGLRSLGDALGGDPIITGGVGTRDNPGLSFEQIRLLLRLLDDKYPGASVLSGN